MKAAHGQQTTTVAPEPEKREEKKEEKEEETLVLRLKEKPQPRVSWTEDTVDNEHMNRKKSNRTPYLSQSVVSTIVWGRRAATPVPATTRATPLNATGTPNISTRRSAPN